MEERDLRDSAACIPDGYTGPFSSFDTLDGVAFSSNRSYARNSNGTMTAVSNLGGLEKGNNIFYMSTKGFTGDSVRVTFTFIESNSSVVWMAPANTADWTQQSKIISIPAGVSRMSLSFAAVKRNVPGNIKISGMQLFSAGVQKKENMMATHPIENAQEIAVMPLAYPNPFLNQIELKELPQGNSKIEVYNLSGEMIFEENSINIEHTLDTHNWKSGLYIIKLVNENQAITKKVLKLN